MIDVETTGLSPVDERIIELAIIRADEHGRPIDQWVSRVHPEKPVSAAHVHGLTDADLESAPRFSELALTVGSALQGLVVVAHHTEFDISFLRAEFARASLPMPKFTTYCTLQSSTLYLPQLQRRRLADCCHAMGIAHRQAHSALGDAYAAAGLLERYLALDAQTGYDDPRTATRALRAGELGASVHSSERTAPPLAPGPVTPEHGPAARTHSRPADREDSPAAVRAWARENGIPVGDRGRLSAELVEQYRANRARSDERLQDVTRPPEPAAPPEAAARRTSTAVHSPVERLPDGLTITPEFQTALDHLHAGHHLFLTGKAGTGKSTLIRHYLEATSRRTITVAPTGIAALNVDGYTIHRLFSFPIGVTEEIVRGKGYYPRRFAKALSTLDTLIIDEASMVRADMFDALTAALERFGPRPGTPFGGVQLVLVGDLYQLPPIVTDAEAAWVEDRFGTPFFFSALSFDATTFPVVELGTVFRQLGDDRLVHLLNAVREGALLEEARAELNQRTDPDFEPALDEFWLTLATTNRIVGARNRQMLERLPDPAQEFTATITGETDGFEYPTDASLWIAAGAQIMMLNNDPSDRWVNGTLGKVLAIESDDDGPLVTVQLRDARIEKVRRHTWDITRPSVQGGSLVHEVVGTFTQLPMKLAWAITIHKSQGQTLDRVVVDLTGGTFANGQLYVALSRCTNLEGLVLKREVLPRDLKTDQRVRRYLATGSAQNDVLGEAYLSVLSVGTEGDRWRPRPVEIAIVTDDGDQATTVINPTSDLYDASPRYGLTTRDVQLAPLLAEAWPALSSLLAGRVPVGVHVDRQLAHIDFELKRNGIVEPIPLGLELPGGLLSTEELARLKAPTALERARAVRDAVQRVRRVGAELPGTGTAFRQLVHGYGYLLARTTGPEGTTAPAAFVVGGNLTAEDDAANVLARLLTGTWERVLSPDQEVVERLCKVEQHYGVRVLPDGFETDEPVDVASVLTPGARVCFSGSVRSPAHGQLGKEELHRMAESRGLVAVPTLTKTKTDVLVVAEAGSQSSKAKNAAKWGKPVVVAEEFLGWAGSR
ncbi:exonuclease domain-containing protein [Brachybacterium alimentarium]|uniref:exonuclease domain-containing protein n=1 Tax=Brachybacterium alimentarium TaxID=47845 RepID=UPI003FD29988